MVDYIVVPHDYFKNYENFEVHLINDIICKYNLQSLVTSNSKPPDHSVVVLGPRWQSGNTRPSHL